MLKKAMKEAQHSNHSRHKHGAVIVKGNRILSSACNMVNRGCKYIKNKRWDDTLHAEAHAIAKLLRQHRLSDLIGADLYVTRINKVGHPVNSKPCPDCIDAINAVGIRRVFYTDKEGVLQCL